MSGDIDFDGLTDGPRLEVAIIDAATRIVFPPVEDLIADRLAQYESDPANEVSRLDQARQLFALAEFIDQDYLRKRVSDECLDSALVCLVIG